MVYRMFNLKYLRYIRNSLHFLFLSQKEKDILGKKYFLRDKFKNYFIDIKYQNRF